MVNIIFRHIWSEYTWFEQVAEVIKDLKELGESHFGFPRKYENKFKKMLNDFP